MALRVKYCTWDYVFLFWFLTNALFDHSLIGTIGQAFFMFYSLSQCFANQKFRTPQLMWFYVLFVFICYLNILLGNSVKPENSRFLLNVLIRNSVFLYCMFAYVRQMDVFKLSKIFVFACILGSISMLMYNRMITGTFVIRDAGDDGLNGNMMATMNAMAICCIFALDRWKSMRNIIIVSLLILFCILAGTRKAFIVLVIGMAIYILLANPKKFFKNISKLLIILYIIYFLLMEVPFIYDIIGNRFESLFSFAQGGDTDASTDTRNKYIELGYYYFLQTPWTGLGINCFKEMPGVSTYSHNNYIELLFSVGIPGVAAYYLMHSYILKKAFFNNKVTNNRSNILAIALILSVVVAEYAMVTYYERTALFYYMLILRFAMEKTNISNNYLLK